MVRGATIVESRRPVPVTNATVVITDGRITAIGGPSLAVPRDARVVDGRGSYLIPGLWDMHVHMAMLSMGNERPVTENRDYFFPLLVAHGVLGVRDMSGQLGVLTEWRRDVDSGRVIGPRLVVTGFKVGQWGRPVVRGGTPLRDDGDLPKAVTVLADGGADFVKVDGMWLGSLRRTVAEARQRGLPVVGHLSPTVSLLEAADAGIRGVEHLQGALAACSTIEARAVAEARAEEQTRWGRFLIRIGWWKPRLRAARRARALIAAADPERCREVGRRLAESDVWLTPTLIGLKASARLTPPPDSCDQSLLPVTVARRHRGAGDVAAVRATFERNTAIYRELLAAGAPMLAGTDTPGSSRIPGSSLLDELSLMVEYGASPRQALYSATEAPARFLGLADSLGTVEVGRVADLVLVGGNPLDNIRHLRSVRGVVLRGQWLDQAAVEGLRAAAADLVARWNSAVQCAA